MLLQVRIVESIGRTSIWFLWSNISLEICTSGCGSCHADNKALFIPLQGDQVIPIRAACVVYWGWGRASQTWMSLILLVESRTLDQSDWSLFFLFSTRAIKAVRFNVHSMFVRTFSTWFPYAVPLQLKMLKRNSTKCINSHACQSSASEIQKTRPTIWTELKHYQRTWSEAEKKENKSNVLLFYTIWLPLTVRKSRVPEGKKNIHSTEKWSLQMLWQNLIITLCCPSFIWTITHEAVSLFVAITSQSLCLYMNDTTKQHILVKVLHLPPRSADRSVAVIQNKAKSKV